MKRPIVVTVSCGQSVGPYVCACVRPSVCPVHCGKTADRIRITFGVIGRTGPGMRQVVGFGERSMGRGILGGKFGARHCNQCELYPYGCDTAAMRHSSQITLGRLANIVIIVIGVGSYMSDD